MAQPKGSAEPPPLNEDELKARMLLNVRVGLVFRDLTTGDLGEHMGWNDATKSRRLSGHRGWPVPELLKMASYLRVSLDDLFLPEDKFVAVISHGMKREELLRKLAQSACLRVLDPVAGQLELIAEEPPELTVIATSVG